MCYDKKYISDGIKLFYWEVLGEGLRVEKIVIFDVFSLVGICKNERWLSGCVFVVLVFFCCGGGLV